MMKKTEKFIRTRDDEFASTTRPGLIGDGDKLKIFASSRNVEQDDITDYGDYFDYYAGEVEIEISERSTIALAFSTSFEHSGGSFGNPERWIAAYFIVNDTIYYGGPVGMKAYLGGGDDFVACSMAGCITLDAGTHIFNTIIEARLGDNEGAAVSAMYMVGANTESNTLIEAATPELRP